MSSICNDSPHDVCQCLLPISSSFGNPQGIQISNVPLEPVEKKTERIMTNHKSQ